MTYLLMALLVLSIATTTLFGVKYKRDKNSFMSVEDTEFLRGFWCIVVVLVHVPSIYQNRIQDMMGSFAYIGVTFFFMTSAFGLKYSIEHKEGYMNHFWRRRLPGLLFPALIANALIVYLKGWKDGWEEITFLSFLNINDCVKVLLLMYLGFWLIYGLIPKLTGWKGSSQDAAMILFVAICSLIQRFTGFHIMWIWIVEPLGFAYGIIAAKCSDEIKEWINKNWIQKAIVLMSVSAVFGVAYLKLKPIPIIGDYVLKIILGISIIAFMFTFIGKFKVGNRANTFLGSISYEVYLLHGAAFTLLQIIDRNKVMNSGVFIVCSILITLILSVALKKLTNLTLERVKQ